jgi:hypothetical protein
MSALKRIAMMSLLSGLPATVAFADGPPKLDVTTTCNGATQLTGRDKQACLQDERAGQSTLAKNWSKYRADDKTRCGAIVRIGGVPSYVELLSCLETMQDAKDFRKGDALIVETDQSESLISRPPTGAPEKLPQTNEPPPP